MKEIVFDFELADAACDHVFATAGPLATLLQEAAEQIMPEGPALLILHKPNVTRAYVLEHLKREFIPRLMESERERGPRIAVLVAPYDSLKAEVAREIYLVASAIAAQKWPDRVMPEGLTTVRPHFIPADAKPGAKA